MNTPQRKPVALVIGAGDATGGAIARRFAREGYAACVTRRSADKLQPLELDILRAGGDIDVFVFNIGANVPCSVLDETARKYFKIWEMACYAAS